MAAAKRGAPRRKKPAGHRSNARGTLVMDRRIRGVGRLKRATGTADPRQYRLYDGMVDSLVAGGQLDVLKQLAVGALTFAEVWEAVRPHVDRPSDLNQLPSILTARRLWREDAEGQEAGALAQFVAEHECGDTHRKNLARDARALRGVAKGAETLNDLPELLKAYRKACVQAGTPRMFNMARTTVQAFLRATVGRFHPLYVAVSSINARPEERQPGRPLEGAADLDAWCGRLARASGDHYAEAFRGMAVTGMRPVEFWGAWELLADRVRIRNAKRKGTQRETWREVPLVEPVAPPRIAFATFQDELWLRKLNAEHTAYDGRRTFARALELCGVERSRRRYYMGQGVRDVLDLYERHDFARYLAEDGAKLRRHFGAPETSSALRVERGGGA